MSSIKKARSSERESPLGQRAGHSTLAKAVERRERRGSRERLQRLSPPEEEPPLSGLPAENEAPPPPPPIRERAFADRRAFADGQLTLHQISAHDVPNADAEGLTDPYVRFTLLGSGKDDAPCVTTRHQLNTLNPTWTGEQYTMCLAERAERPFVLQVQVLDKDFNQDDEVLCSGTVELEELLVGRVTRMVLHGHNDHGVPHHCAVSFMHFCHVNRVSTSAERCALACL